jgi:hypothetical protein
MIKLWAMAAILGLPLGLAAQTWNTEARVGYFLPSSSIIRKLFPKGWMDYAIEGSYRLEDTRWCAWGNLGYGFKQGHSIPLYNKKSLWIVPISLGLAGSFEFPVIPLTLRLGVGASYSWLGTHNQSDIVKSKVNKGAYGFVFKTNLHYLYWRSFYANAFADYSYTLFNHVNSDGCIQRYKLNLSGVRVGLGLGVEF